MVWSVRSCIGSFAAIRVAVETSVTVEGIPTLITVIIGKARLVIVTDDATEYRIVIGVGVALGTRVPDAFVVPTVYWEELAIVIERCIAPRGLIMALGAIRTES